MAVATTDQESQSVPWQSKRRRIILIVVIGLFAVGWGPNAASVVVDSWIKSNQVREYEAEIEAMQDRISALEREANYGATPIGRDVEAKRRFGVGPEDEIWITVEAEIVPEMRPEPASIAERVNRWLTDAGGEFMDGLRETGAVARYLVGLDRVEVGVESAGEDEDGNDEVPIYEVFSTAESAEESEDAQ